MAHLKFECSGCKRVLITKYLNVGETAKCRFCGASALIPDNAERTEDTATVDAYGSQLSGPTGTSIISTTSIPEPKSSTVVLDQLDWVDWVYLAWGFFWRGLFFSFISMIAGAVLGLFIGLLAGIIFAIVGIPSEHYLLPMQFLSGALGLGLGFLFLIPYIKWLLKVRFGSLRLVLIRTE